ncbi:MAG: hypothetical protein AAGD18_16615, partial [Actinomycetota bacterium]
AGDGYVLIGPAPQPVARGIEVSPGVTPMTDIATVDGIDPGWFLLSGPADAPSILRGPQAPTRPTSRADALDAEAALCGSGLEPVARFVDCEDQMLAWEEEVDDPPTGRDADVFELSGTTVSIREPVGEIDAEHPFAASDPEELLAGLAVAPEDRGGFGLYRFGYRIDERADGLVRGVIVQQIRAHGLLRYEEFVEPFEVRRQGEVWWLARRGPIAASVGDDRVGRGSGRRQLGWLLRRAGRGLIRPATRVRLDSTQRPDQSSQNAS